MHRPYGCLKRIYTKTLEFCSPINSLRKSTAPSSHYTTTHRLTLESQHRKREELDQVVRLLMDIAAQREAVASMEEHLQAVKMQGQLTSMLIAMANGE